LTDPLAIAQDDVELVRRTRRGERDAIREFVQRMRGVRIALSRRNVRVGRPLRDDELEDLIQETLTAIWSKLAEYRGDGPLAAWAHRFAILSFLARLKTLRRRPRSLEALSTEGAEVVPAPAADAPFQYEDVYQALEALEAPEAHVLRLKGLEGCTFDEVADRTGVPVNTLKARYYRGLQKMRRLLRTSYAHLAEGPP